MVYTNQSKTARQRSGVFISYARSDGEEFAQRLRERLEKQNIKLWQDRVALEGGRDWWLQITEALDNVAFMALVVTPNALKSEIVRKEWRYARQQGVCVYPIKGEHNLDFNSLPRWMRDQHFYDLGSLEGKSFGSEWKKFLNDAICHDERVQNAFDDGILWVTLGENPGDLTSRVEELIYHLNCDRPGFTNLEAAITRLKELLEDRDLLLAPALIRTLEGHSSYVMGCAFSPDGRRIVSASRDSTLKVWDAETGQLLRSLEGHSSYVNGEMIAAGGARGEYFLRLVV